MRYSQFWDVLQMVIQVGRNYNILKKDIKDNFKNLLVAPHHQ